MLKEKKYFEYQRQYEEYKKKHADVERIEESVKRLSAEKTEKIADTEREKADTLSELRRRKKDAEDKLEAVMKNGVNSDALREYSDAKLRKIEALTAETEKLEKEKSEELKKIHDRKKGAVAGLEADRELCRKRLEGLIGGADNGTYIEAFDEMSTRKDLEKSKENELLKVNSKYDESIKTLRKKNQKIDAEYEAVVGQELSHAEEESSIKDSCDRLNEKLEANELPKAIAESLSEPVDSFVKRKGLASGEAVAELADEAMPIDDLSFYLPDGVKNVINIGLPGLVSAVLLVIFILSGTGWGFVATATNATATLLTRLLCIAAGFGILFGALTAVMGKGAGIVGGIAGGILGGVFSAKWRINLPAGVTGTVEWIVKALICIAVFAAVYALNSSGGIKKKIVDFAMKRENIKKETLASQAQAIRDYADSYYCALKYKEIIAQIAGEKTAAQSMDLRTELDKQENEKANAIKQLTARLDSDIEKRITGEKNKAEKDRREYEQNQQSIIQMQDKCMLELASYDEKIGRENKLCDDSLAETKASYDKKIAELKGEAETLRGSLASDKDTLIAQLENDIRASGEKYSEVAKELDERKAKIETDYDEQISKCFADIDKKNSEFAADVNAMNDIFSDIYSNTVGFEESKGVLSDYIYLCNRQSEAEPKLLVPIKHDKKPVVFLYDLQDTTGISAALYEFMRAVMSGLYAINAKDTFELIVTDPVSKARRFAPEENRILSIQNDIKELSGMIQNSMKSVSQTGMSIDDYNRKMSDNGEDKVKYFKYKIVEFVVPEEAAAQNTNFFDSDLWGTLGDGKENGFLPIFFISYADWRDTFDENSRLNSKFILQLKNAIGSSNGSVYKIDAENITAEKIN